SGFNQVQAAKINNQMTNFAINVKKLTPTKKAKLELGKSELGRIERQLGRLAIREEKLMTKVAKIKKHPQFNPNANVNILKEYTKDRLAAEKFQRRSLDAGIDIGGLDLPKIYKNRQWLNYTERHSIIESQTGIPMSQVTMDLIEAEYFKSHALKGSEQFKIQKNLSKLKKLGVSGEQAWEWFHYIRTKNGVPVWDPSELKMSAYTVPEYKGDAPLKEVIDILGEFRKMSDWHYGLIKGTGQNLGYTPGYVAIKPKVGFFTATTQIRQKGQRDASLLKKRTVGLIPKEERLLYETDFYQLIPRMNQDAVNAASFSNVIDKINSVDWMLRAAGQSKRADHFLRYTSRAMGNKNITETIQALSLDLVHKNEPLLRRLAEESGGDKTLVQDAASALYEMMYNSYIGLSKSVIPKQFVQPELVGAAEIGLKNVLHGKKLAYVKAYSKETKQALSRVKDLLYPEAINYDMMTKVQNQWLSTLVKLSNLPGKPGMAAFTKLDKKNREVMFLGAINQFKKASKKGANELKSIMDDLLPAERNRIMDAYNKYGVENAMDQYGLIRAKRANYAYTLAERAEVFSEGLGRYVPFVHWGANQWMRHIDNVGTAMRGNVKPLAARIAYGVAGTAAIQMMLNEKFYPTIIESSLMGAAVGATAGAITGSSKRALVGGVAGYAAGRMANGKVFMSSGVPQSAMFGMTELNPFVAVQGLATADVSAWLRYYKKVDGDIFDPAKVWRTPKRLKKQRKIKGDLSDIIEFKRRKN
ncbi:MAG: hypothetical protein R3213_04220, partial [Flavobacteriaceae bacterium]|nr:hypothetical protein [Flavobacteriaceae bacterium]